MTVFASNVHTCRRVAFYGGSFDPPHRAHLSVARAAMQALELDRVLFAPVGVQPLKLDGGAAPFGSRVMMTLLAVRGEPGFEVTQADAPRDCDKPNYTVDTLLSLKRALAQDCELFCLMGADSLANLRFWHKAEWLPFLATVVVAGRPGVELSDLGGLLPEGLSASSSPVVDEVRNGVRVCEYAIEAFGGKRARLVLLPDLADATNATKLREMLRSRSDEALAEVPAPVLDYIRAHQLYK